MVNGPEDASDGLLIAATPAEHADDDRRSLVLPGSGERLLHADLHNHTLLSDGAGRPEDAFGSMRAAGLDVAALTDHAHGPSVSRLTIDDADWHYLGELAEAADEPGAFVAIRGFEWTSPTLGHMNVWGGRHWTRPLPLAADGARRGYAVPAGPPEDPTAVAAFYDWLHADADDAAGGGSDALVSFNHPGRERARFGRFRFDGRIVERVVGLEMFNRGDDYLFERVDVGGTSPLVECLDSGWRVGLIGVTDEHSPHWGFPPDLGRTGIWSRGLDRASVREAMLRRRLFATRERGLRVDAVAHTAAGPRPMGSRVEHERGDLRFELDVHGAAWTGRTVRVQVLQTGAPLPVVVAETEVVVPEAGTSAVVAPVDRGDGNWVVLRVTDPGERGDPRARRFPGYRSAGRAVAYLSPFFLG
ncbi:CehA/McbA family metallohydrolase [Pseudonocardia humida]|uniref:CehA/McbA family metallohydrolase n=1 Tax=Pseudonocardia humida TaxID=2800819 RepID=A0ABT1A5A4_9PSEU|nr:CehA/McbA family metallohydrolase [Pseudonocardia humida]MCO1658195.1 CehA/McbA family metallohydrolase [Pseudonocardia humida]